MSFTATEKIHNCCGSQLSKTSGQNYVVYASKQSRNFLSSENFPTIFQNLQGEMIFQNL